MGVIKESDMTEQARTHIAKLSVRGYTGCKERICHSSVLDDS